MNVKRIKRYCKRHGYDDVAAKMLCQLVDKRTYKQRNDYKMPSLIDSWHRHYDTECGEYWKEYGLCEFPDDYTDKEIQEYLYEELWMSIHSPYDCTGKAFTICIDWHRNPNGMVSVIHHIGLDV